MQTRSCSPSITSFAAATRISFIKHDISDRNRQISDSVAVNHVAEVDQTRRPSCAPDRRARCNRLHRRESHFVAARGSKSTRHLQNQFTQLAFVD